MEDQLSNIIEKSGDELLKLIQKIVEDILYIFSYDYSIKSDYNIRNEVVTYTYSVVMKKYINKNSFKNNKEKIIKNIVKTYIISKNI